MADARTSSGFGVNPISYADIDAWARLLRITPEPWEVRLLRKIDKAVVQEIANRADREKGQVDVNNVAEVSSLFASLRARQEAG